MQTLGNNIEEENDLYDQQLFRRHKSSNLIMVSTEQGNSDDVVNINYEASYICDDCYLGILNIYVSSFSLLTAALC